MVNTEMASSSTLLSQINDDYLTCQICMEPFQSPKVLSCQHSFCTACLESCEKTAEGSYILCPVCRQRTVLGLKGVQGLKNNFVLSNIIAMLVEWRKTHSSDKDEIAGTAQMCQTCPANETAMATYQCIECLDHLCADCAAFHSRTKLTKDHEVVTLEDIENGKYKEKIQTQEMSRCAVHKTMTVEHYCTTCSAFVCRDCIVEVHQRHLLVTVNAAIANLKVEIGKMKDEMEKGIESLQKSIDEVLLIEESERKKSAEVEQDIETCTEDFIAFIKEKRHALVNEVEDIQTKNLAHFNKAKEHLEMQMNCMLNCTQLSNCVLKDGKLNEIVSLKNKMSQTMEELQKASKNTAQTHKENMAQYVNIIYVPGNIHDDANRGMGVIQKREQKTNYNIKLNVFESKIIKKQTSPSTKRYNNVNTNVTSCLENNIEDTEPCCSSATQFNTSTEEVLYVELPEEIPAKPVPTPRKNKNVTTLAVIKPTLPSKPSVMVKPQIAEPPDCYKITRIKGMVQPPSKPAQPAKKQNHYPTMPHSNKHRVHDKIFKQNLEQAVLAQTMSHEIKPDTSATSQNDSSLQEITKVVPKAHRTAPDPPTSKHKPVGGQRTTAGTKIKSHKKSPAPLPPTSKTTLKADVLRVFGTKGPGYRDFKGPPQGVAMANDKLLVLDGEGQQVLIFNIEGYYESYFTVNIPNQGKIKPSGLATSQSNQVYVLFKNVVTVWTMEGTLLSLFGHNDLVDAHGIATDSQGRIVVADQAKHEIVIFSKRGNKILQFGSYGNKDIQFQCPRYICITSRDEIVVSDHHNHSIKIFDNKGQFMTKCISKEIKLKYPESVAIIWPKKGQKEVILVADEGNNRISAYDLQGRFLYHVLEANSDLGLKSPQRIAASDDGKLVIFQTNSIQGRIYNLHSVIQLV